jgi:malate dehydrogenase (oxaloacetate-decarboxylating)(NADP+)
MQSIYNNLSEEKTKKKIIFAEGEELEVIKSAIMLKNDSYAEPILVGRSEKVKEVMKNAGISEDVTVVNAGNSEFVELYTNILFEKLGRKGFLRRDCERLIKTDRNHFASAMLEAGHANSLVTGFTRGYQKSLHDVSRVLNRKDDTLFAVSGIVVNNKTIFIADTAINENPSSEDLAKIAVKTAKIVERFGVIPRVAFVSYSNFGSRQGVDNDKIAQTIKILEKQGVSFEFDGEMMVDVALSENPREYYPFNRLTKPANILITPNLTSAHIAMNLLESAHDGFVIGPMLCGFEKSVQILRYHSTINEITNLAALSLAL